MSPVRKAGGSDFRKDVEFVTKDDDEQIASGIVMVPDKADLQNDFAREETIRGFADQFETFEEAGEAGGGIMHAVFPDDWMDLERNEVLDEAEEIGGVTAPAGAWVQDWRINETDLWELVSDGILSGYSIGAVNVDWTGPYEQGELDDVEVPEELGDELVWELVDGLIREVSAVDIPAVPDAQILDTKAADTSEKRLGDYLGDPNGFLEEAMQRGHSEDEAEQLWDVLSTAAEEEGAGEPGKQSAFARLGKAVVDAIPGMATPEQSLPSKTSRARADEQVENDAGDETPDGESGDDEEDDDDDDVDAAADDTNDDTTDMSDTPDDDGEDKSLAEQNAEQIGELTQAVTDLTESITGPEPKTAEIEIGGETYEVPEDAAKAALGVDEDAGVTVADAIKQLNDQVERANTRIDAINRQSGGSGQVDAAAAAAANEGDDESGLDDIGKALS